MKRVPVTPAPPESASERQASRSAALNPPGTAWHARPLPEVAAALQADLQSGLSQAEAAARRQIFGLNELREAPLPSLWERFRDQFKSFVVLLLLGASILSLFLGDYVEAAAITAIVALNAVLGVVQESRAEAALASLRRLAAPTARVLRDGHQAEAPAGEVVPGDIVLLSPGHHVPADVRLIESVNLRVDEAAFTGESAPVDKQAGREWPAECAVTERTNMAFMGTLVTYGRGRGLVVATGMQTEIGRIAELMQAQPEPLTPLQAKLDQLGRSLSLAALALCGLVFAGGLFRHFNWLDTLIIAVSLAVAAVPEGLPAVVTLSLALGMREMIRRKAIIRRLPAVETLGATTIICTDKTGTVTQNKMSAVRLGVAEALVEANGAFTRAGRPLTTAERKEVETLLRGAMLCNDARLEADGAEYRAVGDPTETALLAAAAQAGLRREAEERATPRVDEIPFQAERQRMSTLHRQPGGYRLWTKGAPEMLLAHSDRMLLQGRSQPLSAAQQARWRDMAHEFAREGLRVLAVAYRDLASRPPMLSERLEERLVFVGLIGLVDPARPEVAPAVAVAEQAGVRTLMVTGDQPLTARHIAAQAGLLRREAETLTGAELEALSIADLGERLEHVDVIARAAPSQKVKIVEALQGRGHVVAMTGDGVNDAPALRRADVGIAMGLTGTDVAKEAADMVLADDNYASIVAAIEQGRAVYDNIRKFAVYLLSCNVAEIAALFIGTLAGWPPVLTAVQLLWLNLITDGAPALALGMEKGDPDLMRRPARRRDERIIDRRALVNIAAQTIALTTVTLAAYGLGRRWQAGSPALAETMAFVTLSSAELLRAYSARSERHAVFRLGLFSNRYMQAAVGTSFVLLLSAVYAPFLQPFFSTIALGAREWGALLPLICLPTVAAEALKWWTGRREPKAPPAQGRGAANAVYGGAA